MVKVNKIIKLVEINNTKSQYKRYFLSFIKKDNDLFESFYNKIMETKKCNEKDLEFFLESDPAADSKEEILLAYPGYKAIFCYRIAHILYELGFNLEARIISEYAHKITGIDIHPGAKIGCPFFIDHGTGIVIGETTIIGKNVKIYQGVTLGALSLSKGSQLKGVKRHPTIGDNVIIYSGASILGGDVVIGNNTIVGSGVFLQESIPADHKVILAKPELSIIKKIKE